MNRRIDAETRRRAEAAADEAVREGRIKVGEREGYIRAWICVDRKFREGKKR